MNITQHHNVEYVWYAPAWRSCESVHRMTLISDILISRTEALTSVQQRINAVRLVSYFTSILC